MERSRATCDDLATSARERCPGQCSRGIRGWRTRSCGGQCRSQVGSVPTDIPQGCEIAVLHGDPAKPNADVFLKVPAKYEIPPHSHTSAERMVLVSGELQVMYRGQTPSMLKPGMYAYGPAGAPHKASCKSAEACVLFIAFEAPVDAHAFDGSLK